jgi:hypothetical protein
MNSYYFTTELVAQRNAQLIAEAKEYRLAKSFRKAARGANGSKARSGDRVPDVTRVTMA